MSLSNVGYHLLASVYNNAAYTALAGVLTYTAAHHITRLHLAPQPSAKFVMIAATTYTLFNRFVNEMNPKLGHTGETIYFYYNWQEDKVRFTKALAFVPIVLYGLYSYASPEKSLKSFAKLCAVTALTFVGPKEVLKQFQ